jgi:hypothetical protein
MIWDARSLPGDITHISQGRRMSRSASPSPGHLHGLCAAVPSPPPAVISSGAFWRFSRSLASAARLMNEILTPNQIDFKCIGIGLKSGYLLIRDDLDHNLYARSFSEKHHEGIVLLMICKGTSAFIVSSVGWLIYCGNNIF